jgi:hypothetical protein
VGVTNPFGGPWTCQGRLGPNNKQRVGVVWRAAGQAATHRRQKEVGMRRQRFSLWFKGYVACCSGSAALSWHRHVKLHEVRCRRAWLACGLHRQGCRSCRSWGGKRPQTALRAAACGMPRLCPDPPHSGMGKDALQCRMQIVGEQNVFAMLGPTNAAFLVPVYGILLLLEREDQRNPRSLLRLGRNQSAAPRAAAVIR